MYDELVYDYMFDCLFVVIVMIFIMEEIIN